MSVTDWFRRLFSPSSSPNAEGAENEAIEREEYGEEPTGPVAPGPIAGGVSGLAGLEDAEAVEDDLGQFESPSDPAP